MSTENSRISRRSPVRTGLVPGCVALFFLWAGYPLVAQDTVELLSGTRLSGKILEIRKSEKEFDFRYSIGGNEVTRKITYDKVHAVQLNGKRFVITAKPDEDESSDSGTHDGMPQRTPSEVQEIIDSVGASDPDWLASTPLNHPASLDLSWPLKAEGPWNESKNVGQYIWGRVNPNVARWKSGVKLLYECMKLHKDRPDLYKRDIETLGIMYFTLFQDYARAAYWLQKANAPVNKDSGIHLGECYWRLGSNSMAIELLRGKQLHFNGIKLLGDIGEVEKALTVTNYYARTGFFNEAFINAGDALRAAGRLDEAIEYYQRVLDRNQARNPEYLKRFRGRASGAIQAIRLFDKADVSKVADGTYRDSADGYNGAVEVEVVVKGGQIADVKVVKHREKQFYAALTDTPRQILDKQGFRDIDGTSGATITSQAIINATARAMAKGVK